MLILTLPSLFLRNILESMEVLYVPIGLSYHPWVVFRPSGKLKQLNKCIDEKSK